jgi:hypothetical protein
MEIINTLSKGQWLQKASFVLACLFFILAVLINLMPFLDDSNALMDFGSFYAAGIKSRNGENPYDPNSEYIFEINFPRVGAGGKMVNLNPPISIGIFELLSQVDPHRSLIIWQVASVIIYAASVLLLASIYKESTTPLKFMWAFTLAGFWHTIVLGQVYILLLLFTVLGWIFLQKGKYIPAGLAIGFVIILKPNFILWPLFLLVAGYYLAAVVSFITSVVISITPLLFYGPNIYGQWLQASALLPETLRMPGNNSILGLTARFEHISIGLVISLIVVLVLMVFSRLWSSKSLERFEYTSALGIMASLLASPISWTGYTILLLPIFFGLKKWSLAVILAAILLAIPFQIVLQFFQRSFTNFVVFGWLYGWGILLLLGDLVAKNIVSMRMDTR